jgi:hypothetical protein
MFRDMSLGQRVMLTVCIVIVLLFALALFGWWSGRWKNDENNAHVYDMASAETRPELCMDRDTRERVRAIMMEALDQALKTKVEELFAVWLRDATGQPARAKRGMEGALLAYYGAHREAIKFDPPECP